ncbi:hypothetical protein AB7M25_002001 [Pseudomonas sp. AP3_22 TE3818]
MAVGQAPGMLDVAASSRASPLPQRYWALPGSVPGRDPLWERACSRWRWVRRQGCWMWRPLRGQARSHNVIGRCRDLCQAVILCGSGLARDGGGSGARDAGCAGLFAGKSDRRAAAPTGFVGCQLRRARAPMAMNSAAIARASWRSPRATSSGICASGMRRHSRGSGSSPSSWQGLSCSASTTR